MTKLRIILCLDCGKHWFTHRTRVHSHMSCSECKRDNLKLYGFILKEPVIEEYERTINL